MIQDSTPIQPGSVHTLFMVPDPIARNELATVPDSIGRDEFTKQRKRRGQPLSKPSSPQFHYSVHTLFMVPDPIARDELAISFME